MGVTLDLEEARGALAALPEVNLDRMAVERLQRLQTEMAQRDVGEMLLYDPVNGSARWVMTRSWRWT